MESVIVSLDKIRQKEVWHFRPYSHEVEEVTSQLEQSPFPVVKLGELIIDAKRGFPKRGTRSSEGIPLITISNLKQNGVDLNALSYISPEEHQKLEQTQLQPNDILIGMIARPTIAAVYEQDQPANISQHILRVRLKSKVHPAYLVYYLNSELGHSLIQSFVTGAVQPMLSIKALMNLPVILPSLPQQKQIVKEIKQTEKEAVTLSQQAQEQYSQARTKFDDFINDAVRTVK